MTTTDTPDTATIPGAPAFLTLLDSSEAVGICDLDGTCR
jgi:hypothetical protein